MTTDATPPISCVSLGMLIMDEIRMPDKPPLVNVIGGSSTFVTLGLRLFADDPATVGCLVLAGSDFPPEVEDEVRSWGTTLVLKKDTTKSSSRGLLTYEDDTFGPKTFSYTTPPIRATPRHLIDTPLLAAKAFHFFGRPEDILEQVPELLRLRASHDASLPAPLLVWEPLPSSCTRDALPVFLAASALVDVFSPNHLELAALFPAGPAPAPDTPSSTLAHLARLGAPFVDAGIGADGHGALVLRCGELGALAMRASTAPLHVPAFHARGSDKVRDATGAGNAFLGGYMAGWLRAALRNQDRQRATAQALCCGAAAAGCAIEQIGLPAAERVSGAAGEQRVRELETRFGEQRERGWQVGQRMR